VILFAGYSLNRNFITEKYCVNKNKPSLHCNGKCHLAKVLKDEERKDSQSGTLKEKLENIVYQSDHNSTISPAADLIAQIFTPCILNDQSGHHRDLFQPPRV
jgi:hypothetical protein